MARGLAAFHGPAIDSAGLFRAGVSNFGLAVGGNKIRKLEYLVPDAIAQNCDTLVMIGG